LVISSALQNLSMMPCSKYCSHSRGNN
jgi:hypothetical protein